MQTANSYSKGICVENTNGSKDLNDSDTVGERESKTYSSLGMSSDGLASSDGGNISGGLSNGRVLIIIRPRDIE